MKVIDCDCDVAYKRRAAATLSLSFTRKSSRVKPSRKETVNMSNDDNDDLMDFTEEGMSKTQDPTASPGQPAEEEDVQLSLKWSESSLPIKYRVVLEKLLQTWFNDNQCGDCSIRDASDHDASIRVPASALKKLEELTGKTLTSKDGEKKVEILSIKWKQTQISHKAPVNLPPESDHLLDMEHLEGQDAKATEETHTCSLSVGHFWYVNHIYKEEMNRIEKRNGVKFAADVMVKFEPNQENGNPAKALAEFTNLVQKSLPESISCAISLKDAAPEDLRKMLEVVQESHNKVLLTVSSEEIKVFGPSQSQDAIKSLNMTRNTSANTQTTASSNNTSMTVSMSAIKDPLVEGLTFAESDWKPMKAHFKEQIAGIKDKFDVDFIESFSTRGKVTVKASSNRTAGNLSMESHATRALLRLYQTVTTSLSRSSFTQHSMTGSDSSVKNTKYQSEGASSGPVSMWEPGNGMDNSEGATGGATAEDEKDTNCPICLDTFKNKKQLKCKHEFCKECLQRAKDASGPVCPLCKDVFGLIEGDQPKGKMTWNKMSFALPGFPDCDTIRIDYDIPGGTQTKKHPKPGKYFNGVNRHAYLPDNKEGNEVLKLLKKAFDQKLIFTVGTSRTTGMEDQVTWNDIHHKTSTGGGPVGFGYPDPDYLSRVRDELKAKGIV